MKDSQLQIRVSTVKKATLKLEASRAGQDLSSWILCQILPDKAREFVELCEELAVSTHPSLVLSELNGFLSRLPRRDLLLATRKLDVPTLSALSANLVAAMVEQTAANLKLAPPSWARRIKPLSTPYFASEIVALRPYLLVSSPVVFRRRNLFVDSTIGARV